MTPNRLCLKLVSLTILLSLALPACAPAAEPLILKMAVLPILDTLPMYVAQEDGLFEKHKVSVEFVPVASGPERDQLIEKKPATKLRRVDSTLPSARFVSSANYWRWSHQGGWRSVIVHPAESMNLAAANALLKTLEEPPKNVLLMLVSHQPRRLLPTVLSRCRKLARPLPPRDSALAWLGERGLRDAGNLLHEAGGAPLLALEYADGERVQRRQRFIEGLSRPRDPALYELAKEFQGRVPEVWAWLSRWLYDLLAAKSGLAPRYFPGERRRIPMSFNI